ncbi:MAG TPA: hypothetical protein VK550_01995 [Polyangiaceae bacterium]|nr:hypothetical protein [Polyangiaceae bacterium]
MSLPGNPFAQEKRRAVKTNDFRSITLHLGCLFVLAASECTDTPSNDASHRDGGNRGGAVDASTPSDGTGGGGRTGGMGGMSGSAGAAGLAGSGAGATGGSGGSTSGGASGNGGSGAAGGGGSAGTAGGLADSGIAGRDAGGAADAISDVSTETGGPITPIDQTTPGSRAALPVVDSFDGLGGAQISDHSLAVGPNHIVHTVNTSMAVFSKKGSMYATSGMVLRGPVATNSIFAGFGGRCQSQNSGDAVVRFDQLAQRWVFILPVFAAPYAMCYAVSVSADPLGAYNRYEFPRQLFPDYPRPGIWPDGYYVGTSSGDDVVQKHICVADRAKMLAGQPATEQCFTKDGVNFLNPADIDGQQLPTPGAPNIVMALGGTQLQSVFEDDGVYVYKFHVDWATPANTSLTGPVKIPVARYKYLCNGQLSSCVPQLNTTQRLDSQGDKLMQRLVYRKFADHESIVATHSITNGAAGGVRWYEFRIDASGNPYLYQQSTYVPDVNYRWLASAAMDAKGNIGIGYSFGGSPNYPGQRFAARLADDPLGILGFRETVIVEGQASQTSMLRWEDFTTTAIDPTDDMTFWYVGDYFKAGATSRSSRIAAVRVP